MQAIRVRYFVMHEIRSQRLIDPVHQSSVQLHWRLELTVCFTNLKHSITVVDAWVSWRPWTTGMPTQ